MRKLLGNKEGFSNLVPMVLAVVITFALLFIGAYINGTIHEELENSFPNNPSTGSPEANALNTMNNTSSNWNTAIDIVQVVIIITILAGAIGAIFLFTRFR